MELFNKNIGSKTGMTMPRLLQMLFHPRNLPAWVVLIVCLALLLLARNALHKQVEEQATQAFNEQSQNITDAIVSRLNQHEQILLGGAGLFNASTSVERSEWRAYVERLQLTQNYPGILGIGFSKVIQPAELASHIAKIRAEGFPAYSVHPPGERSLYAPVIYLEPFSGRNLAALGYDMISEPVRSGALHLAVDENKTTLSGKVTLIHEDKGKVQAGFLMYVPIYRKHMPLALPAQRRAALEGYVYSPYRIDDLMQDTLGQYQAFIDFSIFDGELATKMTEMYVSADHASAKPAAHHPRYTTQRTLRFFEHTWTVIFHSRPAFETSYQSSLDWPMLILGSSTSVMVFLLISMLTIRNIKAAQQTQLLETVVTERTHALQQALDLQTAVLDNAGYSIIATTPDGLITIFNNTAEKLLGYSAQEMIGKQTPALFHDAQEIDARAQQFSAELNIQLKPGFDVFVAKTRHGLPNEHEWIYVCKNGRRFPVTLSITALRNKQNQITGFLGIATDITEHNIARQALLENTLHMQAILNNVADGIITINQQGLIQSFNPSAENIFGYTAREVTGQNVNILMPEPYHSMHNTYLENYHTTGVARVIGTIREVEGLRKDGNTFPLDLAVSQSVHQGQPLYIGLARDITERKRIDKMKNEFVSTVSEELRIPLSAISGSLDLITGGALGELPAQTKKMIDLAHNNLLRLTSLISDLLNMEKLAAGTMHFDIKIQALTPLVELALQNMQDHAKQRGVRFKLVTPVDNAVVRVDDIRLQQVLTHFLSNAIRLSPPGEQIEITVRQHENNVRVEVIDHGPGIPEEIRDQIFQKFFQADANNSHQKTGAGLGLAISKELIQRMKGQTGFKSEPGQGACFYFELPIIKQQTDKLDTEYNQAVGVPRLLVVEDEPDLGRLFAIMLSKAGYNVDIAHNVESALIYLAQHHYDAMTLDLMLPDQSGINLISQIRNQPGRETLPIIVISAYSEDGKLAIKSEFGRVDWLEKPVSSQQLIAAIQRALLQDGATT
jgi:PAS domain S-box-containing protein